jgi:hypothetical protein
LFELRQKQKKRTKDKMLEEWISSAVPVGYGTEAAHEPSPKKQQKIQKKQIPLGRKLVTRQT